MRWCPKCGKPDWSDLVSGDRHVCPPLWLVWDEDNEGPETDDGYPEYAADPETAAIRYADGICTADGAESLRLLVVRASNLDEAHRFVVDPEYTIEWTAHRAEEVEPQ